MKFLYLTLLILILTLLCSCSEQLSPEEEVILYITKVEEEAESRDLSGIKKLISKSYNDKNKRTRKEILQIAASYFLRNKNINILTKIDSIQFSPTYDSASAIVYVAISRIDLPEDDIRLLQAEMHKFDINLEKSSKGWLLKSTEWRQTTAEEFLDN